MIIASMFDESGNALRPWAEAGHACHAFDIVNQPRIEWVGNRGGFIMYHHADFYQFRDVMRVIALRPDLVMGFPVCTDLAVSGTGSWDAKRRTDPPFQQRAVALALTVEFVGNACGVPWFAENPVGRLATLWRKPDEGYFDPYHYGGYLPFDDVHPRWPEYIAPRDAYEKKTGIWSGNGFVMPARCPVEPIRIEYANGVKGSKQFAKLGGKSKKTKQIRSEGPRGFLTAVYLFNHR